MRVLVVVGLLALVTLAGCLTDDGGPGSDDGGDDGMPPASGQPVWVIDGQGNEVPEDAYPGALPAFAQLRSSTRISGEPTIGVSRSHAVFYPAIEFDQVGGLPKTHFLRSVDGGETWENVSPNIYDAVDTHPYSFDPYVYVDPTTSRVYALDMGPNFNCNHVSWSDDDGGTWLTQYFTCPVPVVDHPSIFAGPPSDANPGAAYPNNVYLCTNALAAAHCVVSHDGGASWLESTPVFQDCGGLTGHGHASWTEGTVYLPRVGCGVPQAGISTDGGLTWETIDVLDPSGEDEVYRGVGHEAILSTDSAGNAYIVWQGDQGNRTFVARSTDQGQTWSDPWDVTAPGVTAVKLPSLVAGSEGRIAFLYVGTTTPSGWAVHETDDNGDLVRPDEYRNATWNAYVGLSINAADSVPVFAVTPTHDLAEPLKRGGCEGRCFGDVGGMYDFFDIDIDPVNGQVWTAMVDVCTMECDEPDADADTFQRTFGVVGKQVGGERLLTGPIPAR